MNDDTLRTKIARAERMKEWAHGDEGLFACFAAVEKNYLETLLSSDIEDLGLREKVYHRIAALRDLKKVMELAIAEGRAAGDIIKKLSRPNTGRRAKV